MFNYTTTVKWGDIDLAGIAYYPNFYGWMNDASCAYFDALGYNITKLLQNDKVGIPLIETHCQFFAPLFFEDSVTIRCKFTMVKDKVFTITHQFYKANSLIAEGYETRAWTSFEGKPKAITLPQSLYNKMIAPE